MLNPYASRSGSTVSPLRSRTIDDGEIRLGPVRVEPLTATQEAEAVALLGRAPDCVWWFTRDRQLEASWPRPRPLERQHPPRPARTAHRRGHVREGTGDHAPPQRGQLAAAWQPN